MIPRLGRVITTLIYAAARQTASLGDDIRAATRQTEVARPQWAPLQRQQACGLIRYFPRTFRALSRRACDKMKKRAVQRVDGPSLGRKRPRRARQSERGSAMSQCKISEADQSWEVQKLQSCHNGGGTQVGFRWSAGPEAGPPAKKRPFERANGPSPGRKRP